MVLATKVIDLDTLFLAAITDPMLTHANVE